MGANTANADGHGMSEPGTMTVATLSPSDPARREPLRYAARVLLDSAGAGLPIQLAEALPGSPPGLRLPGGELVAEAELEKIFAGITLQREIDTGRLDHMEMFDETAAAWDVSQPWIDLRAKALAGRMGDHRPWRASPETSFRVVVSHDVDRTTPWEPTSLIRTLLSVLGVRPDWLSIPNAISPKRWLENYQRLLECERRRGVGAYYFLISGPYGLARYASRCDIRWAQSRKILKLITQAGMTVGLHGSYSARDHDGYTSERERLEEQLGTAVACHRNHYLRFDPLRMWSQLEAAGIRYDFSVGFNYRMGFRAGCGRAYRTFDLVNRRPSTVVSIPLLFMDTLMLRQDRREVLRQLRAALEEVKRVNGCVSLLFHPELFLIDPRIFAVFEGVLDMCEEMGADVSGRLPELPPVSE